MLASFLLAFVVSAALVPISRFAAVRLGYVRDRDGTPGSPKPLLGGVAIFATLLACSAALGLFDTFPLLIASTAALFLVGLVSDLVTLRAYAKLVVLIAIASVFLAFGYRLQWSASLTVDSIVTLFWIVGVSTAFDLLDNMDGLCSGIALIAGGSFLVTVVLAPGSATASQAQYLVVLLGSIAGFLIYNISPASIALGEAGSLIIGLNIATMTMHLAPGRSSDVISIIAVPVSLLLIPIFDASLVALARIQSGGMPVSGEHSSARLVALGLSERSAVGLLWTLAAASGAIAIMVGRSPGLSGVAAATFVIGLAVFGVYLARVRIQDAQGPQLPGTVVPLAIEQGYRRRIIEILLDLLLVTVSYYGAYRLRFDGSQWPANFPYFYQSLPIVIGIQAVALLAAGVYRGMWRYFTLTDGAIFVGAVAIGVTGSQIALLYLYRFEGYSTGVFVVYGMLLLVLLVGSRASFRLVRDFARRQRQTGQRLVIYGADDRGAAAVRYLLSDPLSAFRMVGFIDDDLQKRDRRMHGYPVIGGYDRLVGLIMAREVEAVAVTDARDQQPALVWMCATHGVTLHRFSIDWRVVTATAETEALAVGLSPADARVVAFQPRAAVHAVTDTFAPETIRRDAAAGPARPLRVVHIITRLILGGAQENTLYTAIGQCADPRFDVTLLCGVDEAGEGNMFAQAKRAGLNTVVMPSLVREVRPLTDLKALWDVYRFLKRGGYTVVHTHSSKAGIIGRLAARAAGVPVVVHTLHGVAFHEFQAAWKNRLYVRLERICAPLSDRIISVSQRLSDIALARGIGRSEQHLTIYSGIELDLFVSVADRLSVEAAKAKAGIPAHAPVVGKVARLFSLKGHEQFLAAAGQILRDAPDAYFLLVGDGPLRDELRSVADRAGWGNRLVMVGRVAPQLVPEYMQAMDVVVHTSLREGIARVLPQAGAIGKPVVTFDLDGAPEVVRDGVSGYLVPPLDIDGIARRTVELLGDPERRARFGLAGRVFAVEHFSIERMVEQINNVYFECRRRPEGVFDSGHAVVETASRRTP